ncbi:MAG: ribonuclease Y [Armatimonadota bacterium]
MDLLSDISTIIPAAIVAIGLFVAVVYAWWINSCLRAQLEAKSEEIQQVKEEMERAVENERREIKLQAKEKMLQFRNEVEEELKEARLENQKTKQRLEQREDNIDRKMEEFERREQSLADRNAHLDEREAQIEEAEKQVEEDLQRIAALTRSEAREIVLKQAEDEVSQEVTQLIARKRQQAQEICSREAGKIVTEAIQNCAVEHTTETTVSVVSLPSDEMKGRIIGREGRNIRSFEQLTGIDLIVDDTPEAVVLSGFDPVKREIARIALERLVSDGRIHPARIEEMVQKATDELDERMRELGEAAAFECGVSNLHPELIRLLGRLQFRTSYGQNVLKHSKEVSMLAGRMTAEVGGRSEIARRAGLLHDIGKAVDAEREGGHATIGFDILSEYGERPAVLHAVQAHHDDVEAQSVEAALVQAADAISAARPGARRETLEKYVKRLEMLENVAKEFDGVEKVYAIQAGREIRVTVKPEKIDDLAAHRLARGIVDRVESEVDYPGQIRVTIIRETRAVEYAK